MGPRILLTASVLSFFLACIIATAQDDTREGFTGQNSESPEFAMASGMMMSDSAEMGAPMMASMPAPAMAPNSRGVHSKRSKMAAGGARPMAMSAGDGGMFAAADADAVRQSVADMGAVKAAADGSTDPTALKGTVLIKDGNFGATVPDVRAAMSRVESEMAKLGGAIDASNTWSDAWLAQRLAEAQAGAESDRTGRHVQVRPWSAPTGASMTLRVPVDKFETSLQALRSAVGAMGGTVTSESSSARDVTGEYVDVVARQRSSEVAAAQLEKLMTAANTVPDVLAVKRELDALTSRIEAAKAQRGALEGRATMSTVHVSLTVPQPPQPSPAPRPGWSPLRTAGKAVGALARAGQGAVDILVYALVLVVPVALVLGALAWVGQRAGKPLAARASAALSAALAGSAVAGGGLGGGNAGSRATAAGTDYHAIPANAAD